MSEESLEAARSSQSLPDADEPEDPFVDFAGLFRELFVARRILLAVTGAACVLGIIAAYAARPYYTATSSFVAPSTGPSSGLAALAGQSPIGFSALGKSIGDTYIGVMKSRTVLADLVSKFDLKSKYHVQKESIAERQLLEHSDFALGTRDNIVTISVSEHDPVLARDLANGYLEELRSVNGRLALTAAAQKRLFFGEQLDKEKSALEAAEVNLKAAQEHSGLVAPTGQVNAELESITQLRALIAARQVELAALRQSSTEQNADVIRVRSELANLQGQLAAMQKGSSSAPGSIPVGNVPAAEVEYIRKQRDVRFHEALLDVLAKQYAAARMDEAQDSPVLQILDEAVVPDTKAGPRRLYIVAFCTFLGFLCAALWTWLRPRYRRWRANSAGMAAIR